MSIAKSTIDTRIEDARWEQSGASFAEVIRRSIETAASTTRIGAFAVDVLLTSDSQMRELNRRWRSMDKPTDVLSFPAAEPPGQPAERLLGDIALGFETCAGDARELNRELPRHVAHLAVHGFLHLLGYDHEEQGEAEAMEALEVRILNELGYPDPYLINETNAKPAPAR